ncbi:MAG: universal stress protein [Pirellulales bacterium]
MLKRILVGLGDVEYAAAATRSAIELAREHGAELTGVTLYDVQRLGNVGSVPLGAGEAAKELREHRLQEAQRIIDTVSQQFESAAAAAGVAHRMLIEQGDPLACMISEARYHDLIICGLKTLFEHGVVDDPSDTLVELVHSGVRPILAVSLQPRPIERILVGYSGSMESAKTMKRFVQLGLWASSRVRVVNFQEDEAAAGRLLVDAGAYFQAHGIKAELEHCSGSPCDGLLEEADELDADVIVVGNSAKSLLRRRLFGETALHVMRYSQRSLFLAQ